MNDDKIKALEEENSNLVKNISDLREEYYDALDDNLKLINELSNIKNAIYSLFPAYQPEKDEDRCLEFIKVAATELSNYIEREDKLDEKIKRLNFIISKICEFVGAEDLLEKDIDQNVFVEYVTQAIMSDWNSLHKKLNLNGNTHVPSIKDAIDKLITLAKEEILFLY